MKSESIKAVITYKYMTKEKKSWENKANCNDNMKDNINRNFPLIQSPRRKEKKKELIEWGC